MPITSSHSKQVLAGRYISEKRLIGLLKDLFGENFECEVSQFNAKINNAYACVSSLIAASDRWRLLRAPCS
jgi:hypothetical protein